MLVDVFSDKFVTKENPRGKGVVDLDTPEGVSIFGGQAEADAYKRECLIEKQIKKVARDSAIETLIKNGKLL